MSLSLLYPFIALVALALLAGPMSCIASWRRLSYFSDATAHASLLGVALALIFEIPTGFGIFAMAILIGLYLGMMQEKNIGTDTVLGVIAHGGLAMSILVASLFLDFEGELEEYLFGDILEISLNETLVFIAVALGVLGILLTRWSRILLVIVNPELAASHGVRPITEIRIFTLMLALLVAIGIQTVGALLIGVFLIIPAAATRPWARSPESMAVLSVIFVFLFAGLGLGVGILFDLPTGPSMVVILSIFYMLSSLKKFEH